MKSAFLVSMMFCFLLWEGVAIGQTKKPFISAWVQIGPETQAIARVVTGESTCPKIFLDAREEKMFLRVKPSQNFPVRICEKVIPASTTRAQINGIRLSIPQSRPRRILILGDTGCRIKVIPGEKSVQNCHQPDAWPFLKVIQSAVEWRPDLVIHVGDYLYRESPCPAGSRGCRGSPWGDRWPTWNADFFSPAHALLASAPWVFVRGNHELCSRAGEGWFRFLDSRSYSGECKDDTDPFWIQLGRVQMAVLDSANAEDSKLDPIQVQNYLAQVKKIQKFPLQNGWLLTHRPIWAKSEQQFLNLTLQKAFQRNILSQWQLILAGHMHIFGLFTFADDGPSQFISGNGGTELYSIPTVPSGSKIGDRTIKKSRVIQKFGFMTLEATSAGGWIGVAHDANGKILQQCSIEGSHVDCP